MGMWKITWAVKELNWFEGEMEIIQFVSRANIHVADIDQFGARRSVPVFATTMHQTLCHSPREHIHCIRRPTHPLLLMAGSVRSVIKQVAYQRNLSNSNYIPIPKPHLCTMRHFSSIMVIFSTSDTSSFCYRISFQAHIFVVPFNWHG
jgi:hypothetical protein